MLKILLSFKYFSALFPKNQRLEGVIFLGLMALILSPVPNLTAEIEERNIRLEIRHDKEPPEGWTAKVTLLKGENRGGPFTQHVITEEVKSSEHIFTVQETGWYQFSVEQYGYQATQETQNVNSLTRRGDLNTRIQMIRAKRETNFRMPAWLVPPVQTEIEISVQLVEPDVWKEAQSKVIILHRDGHVYRSQRDKNELPVGIYQWSYRGTAGTNGFAMHVQPITGRFEINMPEHPFARSHNVQEIDLINGADKGLLTIRSDFSDVRFALAYRSPSGQWQEILPVRFPSSQLLPNLRNEDYSRGINLHPARDGGDVESRTIELPPGTYRLELLESQRAGPTRSPSGGNTGWFQEVNIRPGTQEQVAFNRNDGNTGELILGHELHPDLRSRYQDVVETSLRWEVTRLGAQQQTVGRSYESDKHFISAPSGSYMVRAMIGDRKTEETRVEIPRFGQRVEAFVNINSLFYSRISIQSPYPIVGEILDQNNQPVAQLGQTGWRTFATRETQGVEREFTELREGRHTIRAWRTNEDRQEINPIERTLNLEPGKTARLELKVSDFETGKLVIRHSNMPGLKLEAIPTSAQLRSAGASTTTIPVESNATITRADLLEGEWQLKAQWDGSEVLLNEILMVGRAETEVILQAEAFTHAFVHLRHLALTGNPRVEIFDSSDSPLYQIDFDRQLEVCQLETIRTREGDQNITRFDFRLREGTYRFRVYPNTRNREIFNEAIITLERQKRYTALWLPDRFLPDFEQYRRDQGWGRDSSINVTNQFREGGAVQDVAKTDEQDKSDITLKDPSIILQWERAGSNRWRLVPINGNGNTSSDPYVNFNTWSDRTFRRTVLVADFPVTRDLWELVMGTSPPHLSASPSDGWNPKHPLTGISWQDAEKFCEILTQVVSQETLPNNQQNFRFQLLSDHAWEANRSRGSQLGQSGFLKQSEFNPAEWQSLLTGHIWEWINIAAGEARGTAGNYVGGSFMTRSRDLNNDERLMARSPNGEGNGLIGFRIMWGPQ